MKSGLLIFAVTGVAWIWWWRSLVRRARAGEIGCLSAWIRFVVVAFSPLLAGVALLLTAVGFEEVTGRAVVSERVILLLIPFVGLGAFTSAAFGFRLLALHRAASVDEAAGSER